MTKDEIKNRISMALKDSILQQGFEIICKNLAELEKACDETQELLDKQIEATSKLVKENAELKESNIELQKVVQQREQRGLEVQEDLLKENTELKAQIEKMKCCGNCKHFDFNEPNYCYKGVYRERQYVCSEWEFGN